MLNLSITNFSFPESACNICVGGVLSLDLELYLEVPLAVLIVGIQVGIAKNNVQFYNFYKLKSKSYLGLVRV